MLMMQITCGSSAFDFLMGPRSGRLLIAKNRIEISRDKAKLVLWITRSGASTDILKEDCLPLLIIGQDYLQKCTQTRKKLATVVGILQTAAFLLNQR